MAVPTINESPGYEIVASGAAYAKTLTATNTPTSWALSGQPSGIVISSGGAISGTPSVTTATAYTFSATATNGDGTSAAKTWLVVVVPAAVGAVAGDPKRYLDFDLTYGTLQIPGKGTPQPATRPPLFAEKAAALTSWRVGDRFELAVGALQDGVLQDLDVTRVEVVIREFESDPGYVVGELDIAETGTSTTRRFVTTVFLDPDQFDAILSGYEGDAATLATMYLGVRLELPDDDREYSGTDSETIPTLTQSDSDVDTMTVTIGAERTASTLYDVAVNLVCPTDTGLNVSLVQRIALTYSGSAYVLGTVTGTDIGSGSATDARDWDTTLEITSLTATSTGISVETTVTTTAQSATVDNVVCVIDGTSNSFTTDGATISHATSFATEFRDGTSTIIGSAVTISDGDTEADVLAAIETATGENVTSVVFDDGAESIIVTFGEGSTVEEEYSSATTNAATVNMHAVPSYSNATVSIAVTGVEMPENSIRFASASVPIIVERDVARA